MTDKQKLKYINIKLQINEIDRKIQDLEKTKQSLIDSQKKIGITKEYRKTVQKELLSDPKKLEIFEKVYKDLGLRELIENESPLEIDSTDPLS